MSEAHGRLAVGFVYHRFSQRGKRQMNITPFRSSSQVAGGGVPSKGREDVASC
jgi:hypothetical protein